MRSTKPGSAALPITTFSVLCYEIALTRIFAYLFDYHLTALAVSLAMFGLGVGAYLRVVWLSRIPERTMAAGAHVALGASLVSLPFLMMLTHRPVPVVAASALPFFAAGVLVSQYYQARRAERVASTYALDLTGGALACVVSVGLLDRAGGTDTLLLLGGLCAAVGVVVARRQGASRFLLGVAALSVLAAAAGLTFQSKFPDPLLNRHSSAIKQLPRLLREHGAVVDTEWSAVGRADLYETSREADKIIFSDATNGTSFFGANPEGLKRLFAAVPYATAPVRSALILGSGAGMEVRVARDFGVPDVEAVELNRGIIRLVRRWSSFGGPVYDQPGVALFEDEGRKFVLTRQRRYDLIQMSLVLTGSAQSGTFALAEGYLYTREAFRSYFDHLQPEGALCLIDESIERTIRNTVTAVTVLQERSGLPTAQVMENVAVLSNPKGEPVYRNMLLVSPSPLGPERLRRLSEEIAARSLAVRWLPGGDKGKHLRALAENGPEAFARSAAVDFTPPTDDRPYLNFFAKTSTDVARVLWPYILLALCAALVLLAMVLTGGRARSGSAGLRTTILAAIYGGAFMLVELGLLHKLTLAAGGPTQVLSVVLFALLFSCAIGGLVSERRAPWVRRQLGSFAIIVAVVGGLTALIVERWYRLEGVDSPALRLVCVSALVAPLGVCLGAPFPDLLRRHGREDPRRIARLWAVNGVAAVLGSAICLLLLPTLGGRAVLIVGCVSYLLAGVVDRK